MAGTFRQGTKWNVGDTTGKDDSGATVSLPSDLTNAGSGSGVPSSAPTGSPIYINTANNKLYAWTGSAWVAISGANT